MDSTNSKPILNWSAKEKSRISSSRFLKILLIPSVILPFFAGFNPATYTESDITPVIEPIVKLAYIIFENTFITGSVILFVIIVYFFGVIASYIFLIIIFLPLIVLFSLIFDKPNYYAIFNDGIAKGEKNGGKERYSAFLKWNDIYTCTHSDKNEIKIVDAKNKTLMFVNIDPNFKAQIEHYINYYLSLNSKTGV